MCHKEYYKIHLHITMHNDMEVHSHVDSRQRSAMSNRYCSAPCGCLCSQLMGHCPKPKPK